MRIHPAIIAIFAGLASGLMLFAMQHNPMATFLLLPFFIAPIYLASQGWGTFAGFLSAVVASGIIATIANSPQDAILLNVIFLLPAAWIGHLTNLGQNLSEDGSGPMLWFPLSTILLHLTLIVILGTIIAGVMIGYSGKAFTNMFSQILTQAVLQSSELNISPMEIEKMAIGLAKLIPLSIAGYLVAMHTLVGVLCAKIIHQFGLLARRQTDIAASANLPFQAVGLFLGGGVGILFFGEPVNHIGSVVLGAAIMAFGLIGLADLHYKTRGRAGRSLILFAAYGAIIALTLPILIFTVTGIIRSMATIPTPKSGSDNS